jgi:DNA-(apurinic or apyrimidinic site) lyase
MQELYDKLKYYKLEDAIKFEENDRQFIALKNLWKKWSKVSNYLGLIIANSIICYQLSWKWEDYWEEFWKYFSEKSINYENLIFELWEFIKQSKNNKRFVQMKLKRLEKLKLFFNNFIWKEEYYYKNMIELRNDLAKIMKQKNDAKTIVFAVKMFSYWARNCFEKLVYFPDEINIPIDSRLQKIFDTYKWDYGDINKFYFDLSKKLKISELHLDAILWNSNDL